MNNKPNNKPIYLDDLRNPSTQSDWVIIRTSADAVGYVRKFGCPDMISFDHDLGGDDTTMVFLKWLIDYDLDSNGKIIPEDFSYTIHSSNPCGRENIDGLLQSYLNFKKKWT